MRVAIKYCGSCNPYCDLDRIGQEFRAAGEAKGVTFVPLSGWEDIDLLVILNGCAVACADRPDVRDKAPRSLVVTPERCPELVEGMVCRTLVRGEGIPQAMERILEKEMLDEPN